MPLLEEVDVLSMMTVAERRAALRFHETAADDGSYDIPTEHRTRLRKLGLIRHAGRSRFAETELMTQTLSDLETWRRQNPEFEGF